MKDVRQSADLPMLQSVVPGLFQNLGASALSWRMMYPWGTPARLTRLPPAVRGVGTGCRTFGADADGSESRCGPGPAEDDDDDNEPTEGPSYPLRWKAGEYCGVGGMRRAAGVTRGGRALLAAALPPPLLLGNLGEGHAGGVRLCDMDMRGDVICGENRPLRGGVAGAEDDTEAPEPPSTDTDDMALSHVGVRKEAAVAVAVPSAEWRLADCRGYGAARREDAETGWIGCGRELCLPTRVAPPTLVMPIVPPPGVPLAKAADDGGLVSGCGEDTLRPVRLSGR